jgi:sugar phosphate isomerase/epimerase
MQVGIDTYCYHRLYGEIRPGEDAPRQQWTSPQDAIDHARAIGADWLFFETHLLAGPASLSASLSTSDLRALSVGLSWGGAVGFDGGRAQTAEHDLLNWLNFASEAGIQLFRIVVGGPATRAAGILPAKLRELVEPLRRVAAESSRLRIRLAIENHGDLGSKDLEKLITLIARSNIGACIDNVNLIRVGDEMLDGVQRLASKSFMVHLKDCVAGNPTVLGGPVSTALGEGDVDLPAILRELKTSGFSGPICVELGSLRTGADELEMVERSVRWLRAALEINAPQDAPRPHN